MTAWAAPYIGLPFGEGQGEVTCWSLVARVYRDLLSIALPTYGEISSADLIRVARAIRGGAAADCWRAVADPEPFDVVLMCGPNSGRAVVHVGIAVGKGQMLHAEEASGTVLVPLSHPLIAGRILGYRRWAE